MQDYRGMLKSNEVSKDKGGLTIMLLLRILQKGLCFLFAAFQFHFDLACGHLTHFLGLQRKPSIERMGNRHVKCMYLSMQSKMGKEHMHPDVYECVLIQRNIQWDIICQRMSDGAPIVLQFKL